MEEPWVEKAGCYHHKVHRLLFGLGNFYFYFAVPSDRGSCYLEAVGRGCSAFWYCSIYAPVLAD